MLSPGKNIDYENNGSSKVDKNILAHTAVSVDITEYK